MSRDKEQNLDALFIAVIDGHATEAQFAACNRILAEDPDARLIYLQYANVHGSLLADLAMGAEMQELIDLSEVSDDGKKPVRRITARHWLLAAAAVLAIGLFVLTRPEPLDVEIAGPSDRQTPTNAPPTMTVHAAWDAEWSSDELPLIAGDTLPVAHRLHLRSGIVQLRIDNVDLHIQAPASFTLRADASVDLESGMLVGHVKEGRRGFTVHLPTADVVDLATIFGILVTTGPGEHEVHVFRGHGSVEKPTDRAVIASLVSGDAIRLDGDGTARQTQANAEQFRAILPAEALSSDVAAEKSPVAAEQDLPHRQIGEWSHSILADKPETLTWDISDYLVEGYVCDVLFRRSSGAPLQVSGVELLRDGVVVSSDIHRATAGRGAERYRVWAPGEGRQVLLRADVSGKLDADSSGRVWLQQVPMPAYTLLNSDDVAGSNLALNKPVTAAETRYGAPSRVTDGDTTNDGIWASRDYPQSCRVDLEQQYAIDRLRLYLWRDGRSFYQYTISVSVDGSEWAQVVDMSRNTLPSHISGDLHAFSSVSARYVRIDMLYNSNAPTVSVVELEIYGE
jgi:ferric-dicitrate binding protein FerR (iron transport regulator)